jgi:hypothetical protein
MPRRASALLAGPDEATCMLVAVGPTLGTPTGTRQVGTSGRITQITIAPSYEAWAGESTQEDIPFSTRNTSTDATQLGEGNWLYTASNAFDPAARRACVGTEYGHNGTCLPGWTTVAAHHSITVAIK